MGALCKVIDLQPYKSVGTSSVNCHSDALTIESMFLLVLMVQGQGHVSIPGESVNTGLEYWTYQKVYVIHCTSI